MSAIFGETLTFTQGDGSAVELKVSGDEFYVRYETGSGYTAVYDTDLGRYCYATVAGGRFASTGSPVSKRPPAGLRRHLKESGAVRNRKFDDRYAALRPPEPPAAPHAMRTLGRSGGLLGGRRVSEGDVAGLTVLVQFADVTSTVQVSDVEALLNAQGYSANGNYCSVNEYFRLVSDGMLNYTNTVVGPVNLGHDRAFYTTTSLVEEALDAAVNDLGVDLSQFDSRNEGTVDAVNFMYAGRTVYDGELWPHNWTKELTYNGMKTHYYMLTSLGRSPVDLSIGTFCHESGHLLCRFPDLYDYGKRDGDFEKSHGIGSYCLMGSGNHLDRGRSPSQVCGYLRDLVGWTRNEVRVNPGGEYNALHDGWGTLFKYETDSPNEYFIIENRGGGGLDSHLPDSGLAVYHCDTLGSNEWQGGTSEEHYQCGVLQADGHLDLENNVNGGDGGDLFGETAAVALSHETTPSSRLWDGSDSGLVISDVSAPGETVSFESASRSPR